MVQATLPVAEAGAFGGWRPGTHTLSLSYFQGWYMQTLQHPLALAAFDAVWRCRMLLPEDSVSKRKVYESKRGVIFLGTYLGRY